jgi:3-hydroxypropanoate dehydrogenase
VSLRGFCTASEKQFSQIDNFHGSLQAVEAQQIDFGSGSTIMNEFGGGIDRRALDVIFLEARTRNVWPDQRVPFELIRRAFAIAASGPTSMNCQPMRLVALTTSQAKERLRPALSPANVEKTMTAPITLIVAYDLMFQEKLPTVFPHLPTARKQFDDSAELAREAAFRNGTLQGAYLILALRAVGLDVGSMSGFDKSKVDEEFFVGTRLVSNWLINVGYGDESKPFPRRPRLAFDDIAVVL